MSALLALAVCSTSFSQTTIDATDKFAYGANIGWIDLVGDGANGVVVGEHFLSGSAHAANVGWISFGDGSPVGGVAYANSSAGDFGVNNDGFGNLSGYAYGANIGWINFGWASVVDPDRPRVNLLTGDFEGFVYGANLGWINLGSGYLSTATLFCPDDDGDGISDSWEILHFGNTSTATAVSDQDGDLVLDIDEYFGGTDPKLASSFLRVVSVSLVPGPALTNDVTFEFSSTPSRLYRVVLSDDLGGFIDSDLGVFSPDPGSTTTMVLNVSGARGFFRVVAVKPLQP